MDTIASSKILCNVRTITFSDGVHTSTRGTFGSQCRPLLVFSVKNGTMCGNFNSNLCSTHLGSLDGHLVTIYDCEIFISTDSDMETLIENCLSE